MKIKTILSVCLLFNICNELFSKSGNQYGLKIGPGSASELSNVIDFENIIGFESEIFYPRTINP